MKIRSVTELAATFRADAVLALQERRLSVRTQLGAPLVILWPSTLGAVQVVQLTPVIVPRDRHAELVPFLLELNATLELPGFNLDAATGQVLFRAPVLLDMDGGLALDLLQAVVRACQATVAAQLATLRAFATPGSGLMSAGA